MNKVANIRVKCTFSVTDGGQKSQLLLVLDGKRSFLFFSVTLILGVFVSSVRFVLDILIKALVAVLLSVMGLFGHLLLLIR